MVLRQRHESAEQLTYIGIKVTRETVGRWIRVLPHTQDVGKVGLAATRDDLIQVFADRFPRRAATELDNPIDKHENALQRDRDTWRHGTGTAGGNTSLLRHSLIFPE